MDQSKAPFADIPPGLYQSILAEAAEKSHQALSIQQIRDLPKNGKARLNKQLASFLTLDRDTQQYLERVTWKRVGVFSLDYLISIEHSRFGSGFGDSFWDSLDIIRETMEDLYKQFEGKKHHVKSLEVSLLQDLDVTKLLLPYAIKIFENVPPDQIEEVHIHFANSKFWEGREHAEAAVSATIKNLFAPIPSFQNLLSIQITSAPKKWRLPYDLLAATFRALPIVQSIGLYTESEGYEIEDYMDLDEGDFSDAERERLGQAIASRRYLKTLNLYHFMGPSEAWLEMEWLAPLEELTVSFCPARLAHFGTENGQPYVQFIHLFHRTLVSLHLTELNLNHTLFPQDVSRARQFKLLKHLTYGGETCPFTSVPFLALLPSVESLYLLSRHKKFYKWKGKKIPQSQDGPYWPSLKEVFNSKMNLDSNTTKGRHNIKHFNRMKTHCEKHDVKYSMASLQHFNSGWEMRDRSVHNRAGSQQQVFFYPHSDFRARLGLDRHESDVDVAEHASSWSSSDTDSSSELSYSSSEFSSSSEDESKSERAYSSS